MIEKLKIWMVAGLLLSGGLALAEAVPANAPPVKTDPEGHLNALVQALFKECDTNHDGRFDANEAAAARVAALKKYDANVNGRFDEVELRTMMQDVRNLGVRPVSGNADRRSLNLLKYDLNGDGKLDEAERARMKDDLQKANLAASEKRRADLLQKYDANGDGKLDEAETAKLTQEMQKSIPRRSEKAMPAKPE